MVQYPDRAPDQRGTALALKSFLVGVKRFDCVAELSEDSPEEIIHEARLVDEAVDLSLIHI